MDEGQMIARVRASRPNALQLAAILLLMSFLQVNPSRAAETKIWEEFSGDKALANVQRLVDLGPHPGRLGRNRESPGLHRGATAAFGLAGNTPGIH